MSTLQTHSGSCHCGAVKFKVTATFDSATTCNCSLCSRAGHILAFVPSAQFELLRGEDALSDYQFGKKRLHHPFCSHCGVRVFSHGKGPNGAMTAVNLRCVPDLDLVAIPKKPFDGKSLPID